MAKRGILLIFFVISLVFITGCVEDNNYTIEFNTNGGSTIDSIIDIESGSKVDLPIPTKENSNFIGWYMIVDNEEVEVDDDTEILGNWTFYARWEIKTFNVIFKDFDGTVLSNQTVEYGKDATAPLVPSREGYKFTIWDKVFTNITEDLVITALYEEDETYINVDNKARYDQFMLDMEQFNMSANSNHISVTMSETSKYITGQTTTTTVNSNLTKLRMSPFYLETKTNNEHLVIKEEYDSLFEYVIPNGKIHNIFHVERNYISEMNPENLVDLDEYLFFADDNTEDYTLDYNKILIQIEGSDYILSGKYKDFLPVDQYNELKLMFQQLGYSKALDQSTFLMIITINNLKMIMDTRVVMPLDDGNSIEVNTITQISYEEFETIDLNDSYLYYITKPNTFDEVIEETDVLSEVTVNEGPYPHYFRAHFEGGQYYINDYFNNLTIELYDENREKINIGYLYKNAPGKYRNTFVVPEGDFYIKITTNISMLSDYRFVITKLDYNDTFDPNNPIPLTEGNFTYTLEGSYDLIYANYVSPNPGVILVTPNNNNLSRVYYNDGLSSSLTDGEFGAAGGKIYPIVTGDNYFYLFGNALSYDYTIEFIDSTKYKDKDSAIDILNNKIDDWIITGPNLDVAYFKLEALEKGIYVFDYEVLNSEGPQVSIFDANTNELIDTCYWKNAHIVLDKGSYYLRVSTYRVGMFKLECQFKPLENDVETILLSTYDENNAWGQGFPTYSGISYTNDQNYIFGKEFTLTENSNVLIYSLSCSFSLYNSNNQLISYGEVSEVSGGVVFNLDSGTYLIKVKTTYDTYTKYTLKVAILTCEITDDYVYSSNISELVLGKNTFVKDYNNDVDIVKFVVNEERTYVINNSSQTNGITFRIYNVDNGIFEIIYYNEIKEVTFPVGTYYFVIMPTSRASVYFSIN